jgi:murein DD-endopeptidase MepM/ murein hydrolase activator NlpD
MGKSPRLALLLLAAFLLPSCASVRPTNTSSSASSRPARHGLLDRAPASAEYTRNPAAEGEMRRLGMRWPLNRIQITSPYGPRGREFHEGVDLRAPVGTPVFAAQTGTVIYADRKIRGYGNMVVIRHADGITTIYAHNSHLLVHRGQRVMKGQKIAMSGRSGRAHGPHLHFEIRSGVIALNPVEMMPKVIASKGVPDESGPAANPVAELESPDSPDPR